MIRQAYALSCITLGASFALPAYAQWASREDSPLVLESSHDRFYVHSDGSYENESEFELSVQKETGIELTKLFHIPYDPNEEKITVVEASTKNGPATIAVKPEQIEDKPLASRGLGFTSLSQVTIPFPAVAVGSHLKVKLRHVAKAPFVPGMMNIRLSIAREYFTISDVSEFRSELPLVVKHKGASDLVSFEEAREGNLYTLKVSQQRPAYRLLTGEFGAAIKDDTLPRIEIGAAGHEWGEMAKFFAPKIETALQEPLPPELAAIVTEAGKETTAASKATVVMAKLIERMKYLGDWRNEKGYYLPRSLAEIATTKQGDCKDFSFATLAILRKLGLPARMALVHRGPEDPITGLLSNSMRTFDPLLPGLHYFNHAILSANLDGKPVWLDPTNPMAQVGEPFSDIADRSALILDDATTGLTRIPENPGRNSLQVTSYFAFRSNGKSDVMTQVRVSGPQVLDLKRVAAKLPLRSRKMVLLQSARPHGRLSYVANVSDIDPDEAPKSAEGEEVGLFSFSVSPEGTKTSLGSSFNVSAPAGLELLSAAGGGRITSISLGTPTVETRKTYLANFQLLGELPQDCSAESPWMTAKRNFMKKPGGLIWIDELRTIAREISPAEANSFQFEAFQKKLKECFDSTLLVYKWALPDSRQKGFVPFPNPLIAIKKDLNHRAYKLKAEAAQNFELYTYARLLAQEVIQSGEGDAARAIGNIAHSIYNQDDVNPGYSIRSTPTDADDLITTALARDPDEEYANLCHASKAYVSGDHTTALMIYGNVLDKHPNSPGAILGRLDIAMARAHGKPGILEAEENRAISTLNELLADPKYDCKTCLVEYLLRMYRAQKNWDQVEAQYRRLTVLNPKSAWALSNYAHFLDSRGRYAEAEEFARKSIKVAPVGAAYILLGWALSGRALEEFLKDPMSKKAAGLCEEALEIDSSNYNCSSALSMIYEKLGKRDSDSHLLELAHQYSESAKMIGLGANQDMQEKNESDLKDLKRLIADDPNGVFLKRAPAGTAVTPGPVPTPAAPAAAGPVSPPTAAAPVAASSAPANTDTGSVSRAPASVPPQIYGPPVPSDPVIR